MKDKTIKNLSLIAISDNTLQVIMKTYMCIRHGVLSLRWCRGLSNPYKEFILCVENKYILQKIVINELSWKGIKHFYVACLLFISFSFSLSLKKKEEKTRKKRETLHFPVERCVNLVPFLEFCSLNHGFDFYSNIKCGTLKIPHCLKIVSSMNRPNLAGLSRK